MNSRIEMRRRHAERVLCDTDLKPTRVNARKHQDAAAVVGSGLLMVFMWVCLYFGFDLLEALLYGP